MKRYDDVINIWIDRSYNLIKTSEIIMMKLDKQINRINTIHKFIIYSQHLKIQAISQAF